MSELNQLIDDRVFLVIPSARDVQTNDPTESEFERRQRECLRIHPNVSPAPANEAPNDRGNPAVATRVSIARQAQTAARMHRYVTNSLRTLQSALSCGVHIHSHREH